MLAGYNEKGASIWCLNNCIKIEWRSYKLIRESNVDEYKNKNENVEGFLANTFKEKCH